MGGNGHFILMAMLVTWWPLSSLLTEGTGCNCISNALEGKEFLWGH